MKTKKLQPVLLLIIAIVLLLALPNRAQAYMLYENPQRIILSAPANNYTTANANVSILGACDWTQPLYMNGQPVNCTEHGFFAVYVSLQPGENTFNFSQPNGNTRSITIKRQGSASGSGGSGSSFSWESVTWYETPLWGTVKSNNITHRRQADSSQSLLNALAKRATSRIIGEYGSYYCLAARTFIYKSNGTQQAHNRPPTRLPA